MPLDRRAALERLRQFNFPGLFTQELGWDWATSGTRTISVRGQTFKIDPVAQKRGVQVFVVPAGADGRIPPADIRAAIDREITKHAYEHLLIFTDGSKTEQLWLYPRRDTGRPVRLIPYRFDPHASNELLLQKLSSITFILNEEEELTLQGVTQRLKETLDRDKLTKSFYQRFAKERDAFQRLLKGIPDAELASWYVAVLINRLMFIYFIQEKGFLEGNQRYLQTRLANFQGNYFRDFLCPLFFDGFALPEAARPATVRKLLGRIPYLNGGIFQKHQIEELHGKTIAISNDAFAALYRFFDEYRWHLDERPKSAGKEIDPNVLGYIFEKYINQKQMGAYYTKEDITEYISKNTVLPFLLDATRAKCKVAFENPNGPTVWDLLKADPDRYIYAAVRHGVSEPLPPEIATGLNPPTLHQPVGEGPVLTLELRKGWNKPAPPAHAQPTETWREVIARRQRYSEIKAKLAAGEVCDINDLITLNLDIRQFAQDVIENCEGPDLLRAFWHAIEKITILDPTCGSGAFLFAALNILEPLYEACLDRMEAFVEDLARSGEKHRPEKFSDFRKVLERVAVHPNRRYFIFKSIILNNLYGVDIIEEGVEICKLRLFLKLAAQVEPEAAKLNFGIEPLPDIDFNIRAGNTLVGYATYDEVKRAVTGKLDFENAMNRISQKAADLQQAFDAFRACQVEGDGSVPPEDKQELHRRLQALDNEFNRYLAGEYGVEPSKKEAYARWLKSHQPFHWFVEFYGIISGGGFDVIIGNPPYVETRNVGYIIHGFQTGPCGDLFALSMERSSTLLASAGRLGMIVPVSIVSTDGFSELRRCLQRQPFLAWILNFAERPSKLFTGVEKRLTIWLMKQRGEEVEHLRLSNYRRWMAEERDTLFLRNEFISHKSSYSLVGDSIPKIHTVVESQILARLATQDPLEKYFVRAGTTTQVVYYTRKLRYFVQFFDFVPLIKDSKGKELEPSELKEMHLRDEPQKEAVISLLNSSLFFWFFCAFSDVRNVNKREINAFRCSLDKITAQVLADLHRIGRALMKDFNLNSRLLSGDYGHYGVLQIQSFQPRLSKPVVDEIDQVLARHYGFTEEELDFIINYDIKYRMGGPETEDEGE